MPPGTKKLARAEVELIGRWIAGGAKVEHAEPETIAAGMHLTPEDRAYWAYQPVRHPPLPAVHGRDRVCTPIDTFLLARLESRGLTFAPEADRRTLIRRVTFDLTGLPPTPAEVDAFLADRSPDAYERLVDRLLASPHYGERWGRHWLDVAGYADSEGFAQEDALRPHAYKYRDYVIRALNADKPFDEFVREQLAGDELGGRDLDRQKARQVEAQAAKIDRERLKKQQEFIEATFNKEVAKLPESLRAKARAARTAPAATRSAEQKKLLQDYPSLNVSAGSLYLYDAKAAAELKKLADQATAVRARKPVEDFVRALTEVPGQVPATFLFHRGDPDQPKQVVAPGGLTILDDVLPLRVVKVSGLPTTGRRLALARWLTDPRHPLTGRVLVNRVWMHHFGKGLVATPGDFGRLGERPTHPELLDWLASEFVAPTWRAEGREAPGAWSVKHLHRLILTSAAYRQSSMRKAGKDAADPDNKLLGH